MRLLGSLSFRLALIYVALFTASVAVLGSLYYWLAIESPLRAVRAELRAEGDRLAGLYGSGGTEAPAPALERRAGDPSARAAYHALLRADGSVATTNLPSWPNAFSTRWLRIEADVAREGDEDEYEALVLARMMADGARLLIGRDIEDLDELEEGIKDTLAWLLPALALLSIVGGAAMGLAIGRRIEAVSATARRVIAGDLSERIALRGTRDDFERLSETLNLMLDRIEASLEAVRRVSDSVAHELRTPLARLQACLVELQAEPARSDALLAEAVEEAQRLQAIFDAVLRISRIEASRYAGAMEPVDISALLLDALEYYQPEAEARGQMLSAEVRPGLRVRGDRDLLFQAVSNLLDNAIKYTPDEGRISIAAAAERQDVVLTVTDSGAGIPSELHDKVVERFFRAPSTAAVPGLGLGLALVSAVAAFHGSSLRLKPANPGLRVEWRFPADRPGAFPEAG